MVRAHRGWQSTLRDTKAPLSHDSASFSPSGMQRRSGSRNRRATADAQIEPDANAKSSAGGLHGATRGNAGGEASDNPGGAPTQPWAPPTRAAETSLCSGSSVAARSTAVQSTVYERPPLFPPARPSSQCLNQIGRSTVAAALRRTNGQQQAHRRRSSVRARCLRMTELDGAGGRAIGGRGAHQYAGFDGVRQGCCRLQASGAPPACALVLQNPGERVPIFCIDSNLEASYLCLTRCKA